MLTLICMRDALEFCEIEKKGVKDEYNSNICPIMLLLCIYIRPMSFRVNICRKKLSRAVYWTGNIIRGVGDFH